ncbi:MAG: prephenate dehydratase [Candidatus Marinimicrobia bacterium]|nr:prephenate dehydratase [Candidatus Neomarinimicrobiota bacterium]MCF7829492.1 prephenate dehydratase [Candidatus Neomarinimicrobiota bacterium]MCF7880110.1 prephenate dehydratase [Candidatus Neomarinimicrobiota bacterium]
MKVAFQGVRGAFSEAAIYQQYGTKVETCGFDDFEAVFDAVIRGEMDAAMIPVENSIAGSVSRNYDFFLVKPVVAISEVYAPVRHCLLAKPGVSLEDITSVLSHPMALKQCESYLREYDFKSVPEYDTAGAAKLVAESTEHHFAAIASHLAGEIYNLDILAEDIQTMNTNMTRFLVVATSEPEDIRREKTSIAFKTEHHPGALEDCLHTLTRNQINLTKIQSRPIPENPWEYVFYADFEGGADQTNVSKAMTELKDEAKYLKVLGSYPMGDKGKPQSA